MRIQQLQFSLFRNFQDNFYDTSNEHITGFTADILISFALSETSFLALKQDERIFFSRKYNMCLVLM